MLVLSRGRNDKVVFPTLGISIDVLRVDGNKVRLGIDAPREVPVHRHEVAERIQEGGGEAARRENAGVTLSHSIRNRLNTASLGLHVLHRKLEAGETADSETDIFKVLNELKAIESEVRGTPRETPASAKPGGHRALVVEDDANERELLSGYLQMSGFDVDTAIDGLQAMVRLTKVERPHVVLLEMMMPRFDGTKTVSAIRSNPDYRDLKVFGVSGEKRETFNLPVGQKGCNRWFRKPLDPHELVVAIREELSSECLSA